MVVLAGALVHGFPEAYLDRIRSVTAEPDPDAGRHRQMWDLVESIEVQRLHLACEGVASPAE